MEIIGELAFLTEPEQDATGLESPIVLSELSRLMFALTLHEQIKLKFAENTLDGLYDGLAYADYEKADSQVIRSQVTKPLIENMAAVLLSRETSAFLRATT